MGSAPTDHDDAGRGSRRPAPVGSESGAASPLDARPRRCPTCEAPRRPQAATCHRCKSDLTLLLNVERRAAALRRLARRYYARGWYRQAARVARQTIALESTPDDIRLLVCASLLSGDFATAWGIRDGADVGTR